MSATTQTYYVENENFGRVFETTTDRDLDDREVLDLYAKDAGYADWAEVEAEHMGEHPTPVTVGKE